MPNRDKTPMRDRREIAEVVYRDLKESQRATFEVSAGWGRWLLGSLFLIHGGALFGLFGFLSQLANNPAALGQYAASVWWFVAGLILALLSGLLAWMNWSLHSDNYDGWANHEMLWNPEAWVGETRHTVWIDFTNYAALALGIFSAACIIAGAYSILHGNWIPTVFRSLV
jgi:hypothetical protein